MLEVVIFCMYLFVLSLLVLRNNFFTVEGIKKPLLVSLWVFKLIVGLCFYLIFSCYTPYKDACHSEEFFTSGEKLYWLHQREPALFKDIMLGINSDSEAYITEAQRISDKWYQWNESNLVNDNRIVIRVNAILYFISFRFYSIHLLFMSFLSFIGAILLFKAFPKRGKKEIYAATIACFLVPSTVFWSVGVLKEPLLLLGLGGFLFYFRKTMKKFEILPFLLLIASSLLLLCVKTYVFAIVLPMILVFFWGQTGRRYILLKYMAAIVFLSGFYLLSHIYFPQTQIDTVHAITMQKQQLLERNPLQTFPAPQLDGSVESLVKNMPLSLYNSMTKPFVLPVKNIVSVLINIETALLVLLLLFCLIFGNYKRFTRNNFAIFSVVVCLYGFILIGLTTQDMGVIMRYKSIFLPFYVYALIHLLDTNKVLYVFRIRKRNKDKDFDMVKRFEERIGRFGK